MYHTLSSSVASLEQYAQCREESPAPDEVAAIQLFRSRRELFAQVAALDEEILLRLPKSWWVRFVRAGRGRNLIEELDHRWQDCGYKTDDPLRDVIRRLRLFLIEECHYKENELGTQWALQERR